MRAARPRGLTFVELLVVTALILVLAALYFEASDLYYRGILRSAGTVLASNLADARKLAITSKEHRVAIVFRPTTGPYTSYVVVMKGDPPRTVKLPKGVRLLNTNGFIRNHALYLDATGAWLTEDGQPRRSPDPGLLTLISEQTGRVFVIRIGLKRGTIEGN